MLELRKLELQQKQRRAEEAMLSRVPSPRAGQVVSYAALRSPHELTRAPSPRYAEGSTGHSPRTASPTLKAAAIPVQFMGPPTVLLERPISLRAVAPRLQYPAIPNDGMRTATYQPFGAAQPSNPKVVATADAGIPGMHWELVDKRDEDAVDPWATMTADGSHTSSSVRLLSPRAASPRPVLITTQHGSLSPRISNSSEGTSVRPGSSRSMPGWMKSLMLPPDAPEPPKQSKLYY